MTCPGRFDPGTFLYMKIELDPDVVYAASTGKSDALSAILCTMYPFVSRIAIAVSGGTETGLGLVKVLLNRSLEAAPKWQDESAPWRWFIHHLILGLRERPTPKGVDPLLQFAAGKDVPYAAFLKAIRKLPPQQIEAFVLRHGEGMDDRQLAIAMDCSVTAATNHLTAAEGVLKLVASDGFGQRMEEFKAAYNNLSPDPERVKQYITALVRNYVVPRTAARWGRRAITAMILIGIAYALYRAFLYMSA